MLPFIETIRIENGCIYNAAYHNLRMNNTRRILFGAAGFLDIEDVIVPQKYNERTRCRIEYSADITGISYFPYSVREVSSLQLVDGSGIEYAFKSSDRTELDRLFGLRAGKDDVLIVKNGFLTDTSIANIALYDGMQWYTPAHPLLKGTKRMELLENNNLIEKDIPVSEIYTYTEICLFNAMLSFGEVQFHVDKETISGVVSTQKGLGR